MYAIQIKYYMVKIFLISLNQKMEIFIKQKLVSFGVKWFTNNTLIKSSLVYL